MIKSLKEIKEVPNQEQIESTNLPKTKTLEFTLNPYDDKNYSHIDSFYIDELLTYDDE